ncbi:hypothetical protein L1987_78090 [Smallanthus sonchifolius]|uniref:Uncharacterized protein n=1 Tax=Smallanthus sonchifolius TaxID=185202 RepID=A0ACB8ZBF6_9ASTR|nr:hypothetical protein L1987_78090 [Smallanthus sonchifolius]
MTLVFQHHSEFAPPPSALAPHRISQTHRILFRPSDSDFFSLANFVRKVVLFLDPYMFLDLLVVISLTGYRNNNVSYRLAFESMRALQMNLNSSGNHQCLYSSKLTKATEQCRKFEIDLNLPASCIETDELSTHITNSDDEAVSRHAGTEIRMSEYEYQQPLNGRPYNDDSDTRDSNKKDASRKKKSSSSGIDKWKEQVKVSLEIGLEVPPNDGYMWRKYGQKEILNAKYHREYYRCTYRNTHGCCATKQVQRSSEDPSTFDITYLGKHTCPKISKTDHHSSAMESGYGLINFSSTPESASKTSRTGDISSSAMTRNSFELSNWPLNLN